MNKILRRTLLLASLLIAIIGAVLLIQYLFCHAASHDERRIGYYHNEPKDSIDVLFLGASEIYTGWAPGLAYEEYGFTSYPYCVSAAPVTMWKYMLEDALRTQSPELVVVDPYGAVLDENETAFGLFNTAPKYQFLNMVPMSFEKIKMVNELCEGMGILEKLSYLMPFVKHHDNYIDFFNNYGSNIEIISGKTSELKGMRTLTETYIHKEPLLETKDAGKAKISEIGEVAFEDFIDYCKEKEITLLVVHFPTVVTGETYNYLFNQRCNYVGEISEEKGYEYLNLQDKIEKIGLNMEKDFYQPGHLNVLGQKKTTQYLGKYILDKYISNAPTQERETEDWKRAVYFYEKFYNYSKNNIQQGISEYLQDGSKTVKKIS